MLNRIFIFFTVCTCLIKCNKTTIQCTSNPILLEESIQNVNVNLRIFSLRYIDKFRSAIAYATRDKRQIIEITRYSTLRNFHKHFPRLVESTDFVKNFDNYLNGLRALLSRENVPTESELRRELTEMTRQFMSQLLADAFLCLAIGECKSVSQGYRDCVTGQSPFFSLYFGNESQRLVQRLTSTVLKYRQMEKTLQEMHNSLLHSNDSLTYECKKLIAGMSGFNCSAEVPFCREQCSSTVKDCFQPKSSEWDLNVKRLMNYTSDFPRKGFLFQTLMIKYTLLRSVEKLTEKQSPRFAELVAQKCGKIPNAPQSPRRPFTLDIPPKFNAQTERTVIQLYKQERGWTKLSEQFCNGLDPEADVCWDGVKVVSTSHDYDFPQVLKDVRPRPRPIIIESSGYPTYSDDEDFVEASGSGSPPDDEPYPYEKIDEMRSREEIQGESVIISDAREPDAAAFSTVCSSLLALTMARMLF